MLKRIRARRLSRKSVEASRRHKRRLISETLENRVVLSATIGNNIGVGDQVQNFRLAIAATAEYTALLGGQAQAFAAIQTFVSDVNAIFESELSIHFDLVSGLNTVFTDSATDGYTNGNTATMLSQNTGVLDGVLGNGAYDIGHVFGTATSGGAGLGGLGVVNDPARKGEGASISSNPQGPDWVKLVGHEFGHQFNAEHTFNANAFASAAGNRAAGSAYEPASGTTLMSYAGISGADDLQNDPDGYFHAASFEAIQTYIGASAPPNSLTASGNSIPSVLGGSDYTIPAGTPFELTAVGSDSDSGDTLTYTWEQLDLGAEMSLPIFDNGNSPLFRSYPPSEDPTRVFPRLSDLASGANTAQLGEALPTTNRNLNFRTTVRDGVGGINSDDVLLTVVNTGTPFAVTTPNTAVSWTGATTETIVWNVGGTDGNGINVSTVSIDLSLDGGLTYPVSLASSTANDGSESITVPNIDVSEARVRVRGDGNIFFDISDVNFSITANAGAPGLMVTESGGNTLVGEDGLLGSSPIDTYTIALNTNPTGPVDVTVSADGQTEVSLDGVVFSPSVTVTRTDMSPATIYVRGFDDSIQEGVHSGTITQAITASSDPNYPVGPIGVPVNATIADDELQPVIGVDFDQPTGQTPTNWNKISSTGPAGGLIREDGFASGVGLTFAISGSSGANPSNLSTAPLHTPPLDDLDGNYIAANSMTLTWTGLTAGADYNVYLMAGENFGLGIDQQVTITGGTSPAPFVQDTMGLGNVMMVNSAVADSAKLLETDAVTVQADGTGQIQIFVDNLKAGDFAILAGAAIQAAAPTVGSILLSPSDGSTIVSETGTSDTVDVVLSQQPSGTVVIDVSVDDASETSVNPTTLTFDNTNWNTPQTVTVTGVDDSLSDGDVDSTVSFDINLALTTDPGYVSASSASTAVTTIDDEGPALVGVDFEASSGFNDIPVNWTLATTFGSSQTIDLINEDGVATGIDLTTAFQSTGFVFNASGSIPVLPNHPNSLEDLIGGFLTEDSMTLTWSDLTPGQEYELWVFTTEATSWDAYQSVDIVGQSALPTFTMDTFNRRNVLLINDTIADPSRTLADDAQRAIADATGQIQITVTRINRDSFTRYASVAGAAIREVPAAPTPIDAALSVTTNGDEQGPIDVVYTVTLSESNNTGSPITFDLNDLGTGTATSGTDYTAIGAPAQIIVPVGQTTGSLSVSVTDDSDVEPTETIIAQISNPSYAFVNIVTSSATAQIIDNDVAPALTVDILATQVSEGGGPGVTMVTITRNTDTTDPLVVNLSSSDTTEATIQSTATIPAGQASVTVPLDAVDDAIIDGTQTVTITASTDPISGTDPIPDATFGTNGVATTSLVASVQPRYLDIAIQPDGKILTYGLHPSFNDAFWDLARFNSDGTPDTGFGVNGVVRTSLPGYVSAYPHSIILHDDNDITLVGRASGGEGFVARYNPDGSPDTSFSGDGLEFYDIPGQLLQLHGGVPNPDGSIVVTGTVSPAGAIVAKINSDGTFDTAFGSGGYVIPTLDSTYRENPRDIVRQSDGKLVIAGSATASGLDAGVFFARFNSDGSVDSSYGSNGVLIYDTGQTSGEVSAIRLQQDDKVVGFGEAGDNLSDGGFLTMRVASDGTLDSTFSGDGVDFQFASATNNYGHDLALQDDGKVLVAGGIFISGTGHLRTLMRYNTDGTLDSGFGVNGIHHFSSLGTGLLEGIWAVELQTNGKLVSFSGPDPNNYQVERWILPSSGTPVLSGSDVVDVTDDDVELSIAPTDADKPEGNTGTTPFTFTVTRTGDVSGSTSVDYSVTGSSASPASADDFGGTLPSGTVNFGVGETSQVVTIDVTGDFAVEPDDGFTVTLTNPSTPATIATATADGIIRNDDATTAVSVSVSPSSVLEDGTDNLVYTFSRTGDTSAPLTVNFTTTGTASGGDFTASDAGTFTFAAGSATATVTIDPVVDSISEADETVILSVAAGTGYAVGTPSSATGTIQDDDVATLIVNVNAASISESAGAGATTVTITRNTDTTNPLDLILQSNDTSEATIQATATIPAGQASVTVNLDAVDDVLADGTQTVTISALAPNFNGEITPDTTFGSGGVVTTSLNHSISPSNQDLVIQPDGKLLTVGRDSTLDDTWHLIRLNADGSYDNSFGVSGTATTTFSGFSTVRPGGIILHEDGRISVLGRHSTGSVVARYTAFGAPDTTFSSDGQFDIASHYLRTGVSHGDGSITAAGSKSGSPTSALVRIANDGTLDNTFGTGGVVSETLDPVADEYFEDVIQLADGKLIAAGRAAFSGVNSHVLLARFNSDGTLDSTYGNSGYQTLNVNADYLSVNGLALAPDGGVVIIGDAYQSSDWLLAKFDASGAVDTSFSGDGYTFLDFEGASDEGLDVVIQDDGKIIAVGGGFVIGNGTDRAVARFNADGSLDTSFSGDGYEIFAPFTPTEFEGIAAAALTDDGKLVTFSGWVSNFVVERWNLPNGLSGSDSVDVTDDEVSPIGPLIGIDFESSGNSPTNWTVFGSFFSADATDLIAEDGTTTSVDVTSTFTGSSAGARSLSPNASTIPQHTQSLAGIDTFATNQTAGASYTARFSDLVPNDQYRVYVFGMSDDFVTPYSNDVTITGANVISFTQPLDNNDLNINSAVGSSSQPLTDYAEYVYADINGEIAISVSASAGAGGYGLAGLAIQKTGATNEVLTVSLDASSISENGGSATGTVTRNTTTVGDMVVSLASDDVTEATVPATVTIPDGSTSATFTVTGVDDAIVDGTQTVTITASAAGINDGQASIDVTDDDAPALGPLVGIDFDSSTTSSPNNWTVLGGTITPATAADLIGENGVATPIDLSIFGAGGSIDATTATVIGSTIPIHTQSLANIGGQVYTTNNNVTFVWSDLTPGSEYEVYVFGLESFFQPITQTVTITGAGTPISFLQTFNVGQLFVNDRLGSDLEDLSSFAQVAVADSFGEITVQVDRFGSTQDVSFGGLAIREILSQPTITADLSVTTQGNESGPVDIVYTVTLAQPNTTGAAISFDLNDAGTGTATPGADYAAIPTNAQITVANGASIGTYTVSVNDDFIDEPLETVDAVLSNPSDPGFSVGVANATATITDDDEPLAINVIATEISEAAGPAATTVTVTRSTDTTNPLDVQLFSSDTTEATIQPVVTIPAGQNSVTVDLNAVDDLLVDGTQTVTITGQAIGSGGPVGLDSTFGSGGLVTTSLAMVFQPPENAFGIQADGKILAASEGTFNAGQIRLIRHNPDGTPDNTFGSGGLIVVNIGSTNPVPNDIIVQPDGKFLVGGTFVSGTVGSFLARFNPDGSLDTSYGVNGLADLSTIGDWEIEDMDLTDDGKVLSAMRMNGGALFRAMRVGSNGFLDSTFGTGGLREYFVSGESHAVVALPGGSFLLAGDQGGGGAVLKSDVSGGFDFSFGVSGVRTFDLGASFFEFNSIALDGNDRILVGGYADEGTGTDTDFVAVRLTSDGTMDTSFDTDGIAKAEVTAGDDDLVSSMQVQNDGTILLVGYASPSTNVNQMTVVRFNTDGSLDSSFDGDGVLQYSSSSFNAQRSFGSALQGEKLLVLGGWGTDFRIARLNIGVTQLVGSDTVDVLDNDVLTTNDAGDAPSAAQSGFAQSYPVTDAEDGARHLATVPGPTLGSNVDTEVEGVHSADADADDTTGGVDDEDGVVFAGAIIASAVSAGTGSVDVELQNADPTSNRLDAWIDFNRDGDWDDAGEQIFSSFDLGTTNGVQTLTFSIPQDTGANVENGFSYARFRVSTAGGLGVTGAASDGEVEDHRVAIVTADPFVVDTFVDESDGDYSTGDVSLREAIELANSRPGADEIQFASTLIGQTISLVVDQLTVTDDLQINGLGASNLTVSGNDSFRVFDLQTGPTVGIDGLTISGGRTTNPAQSGAGIRSTGALTVSNSVISNNHTIGIGADGGGIFQFGGSLTLTDSTVSGNTTTGENSFGGGIRADNGPVDILRSVIEGNSTNSGSGTGLGGGVLVLSGDTTVIQTTISGNENFGAGSVGGGLVVATANLDVIESTISGNTTTGRGGGLLFGSDNPAHTANVVNSTISGNTATNGEGGGISVFQGTFNLLHSTVTNNTAPDGLGSGISSASDGVAVSNTTVTSSIVSGNTNSDIDNIISGTGGPTITSGNFNLVGSGNAAAAFNGSADQTGISNPGLAPLGSNGGPTETHALLAGSPAIDSGDLTSTETTDQRGSGFVRLVGTNVDIGAVELQATNPLVTLSLDNANIPEAAGVATFTATLSQITGEDVTVNLGFSGTATPTDDYTSSGISIVVPAGSLSGTIIVTAVQDVIDDDAETIIVDITSVIAGVEDGVQQQTTIIDDDDDTALTVVIAADSILESAGIGATTATVTRSSGTTGSLLVTLISSDTSEATVIGSVTIPDGQASVSFDIDAVDDAIVDGTQTVTITASAAGHLDGVDTVDVTDDDISEVTVSVAPASVDEDSADVLVYTFTRDKTTGQSPGLTVEFNLSGTATNGTDYSATAFDTVTFAPGASTVTVTVDPNADSLVEPDETVVMTLVEGDDYTLGAAVEATGTIVNDDQHGPTPHVYSVVYFNEDADQERNYSGDGTGQRSIIRKIQVTFGGPVAVPLGAVTDDSFIVESTSGLSKGDRVGLEVISSELVAGQQVVTLKFTGRDLIEAISRRKPSVDPMLVDGEYRLTISGTVLGIDANGAAYGVDATDEFFRLFGDTDGDRDVDSTDHDRFFDYYENGERAYLFDFDAKPTKKAVDRAEFVKRYGIKLF